MNVHLLKNERGSKQDKQPTDKVKEEDEYTNNIVFIYITAVT